MENYNIKIELQYPTFSKYRRLGILLAFFALFFANDLRAQSGCSTLTPTFVNYEPCKYRVQLQTISECFNPSITVSIDPGAFASWSANTAAGWTGVQLAPGFVQLTHSGPFIPLGVSFPMIFTLPPGLTTEGNFTWQYDCPPGEGCTLFPGVTLISCPDPMNASVIGVKYRECGSLPYSNQPVISGWPIQLLDTMNNILGEQLTGPDGSYAFYDLPYGKYIIKESILSGWTPKVPASGQYSVSLDPSQQVVRHFGNCPSCSCDDIYTDVIQLPVASDTCSYSLNVSNNGAYCFNELNLKLAAGSFASVTPAAGWTATFINPQHYKLTFPPNYIPAQSFQSTLFSVTGAAQQDITVSTSYNTGSGNVTCSRSFSYMCPPPALPQPCCPAGSTFGPNLVKNGDFALGNQDFTNDYSYFNPGTPTAIGGYSVLDYNQVYTANNQWACIDHTTYLTNGLMLIVDGYAGPVAWRQQVNVTAGTTYAYTAWVNNLVKPAKNYDDPQMALFVDGNQVGGPLNLPENPDQWVQICGTFTAQQTGLVMLSIRMLATTSIGNDVGIDDISFQACQPPPCKVSISATQNADCTVTVCASTTGIQPIAYQWCDGRTDACFTTPQTPCVPTTYCVTATCADGSTSSATLTFTVTDIMSPVAVCNLGVGVDLGSACTFQVTPAFVDGGSTDNCGIQSMSVNPTTLAACTNTIVTLTVTDWCGNTSTCTMGIQTAENIPPVIMCPPNMHLTCFGPTTPAATGFASATDNCSIPLVNYTDVVTGTQPCNQLIVRTWKATDDCNNMATCVQTISVADNVPPTAVCYGGISVQLGATCSATIGVNDVDAGSTDNCQIGSITINPSSFTQCGTYTVTLTVADLCNNTATCTMPVNVVDLIPPSLACPPNTTLNASLPDCIAYGNISFNPVFSDNCGISNQVYLTTGATTTSGLGSTNGLPFNHGMTTVTYAVQDLCGNTAQCSFKVTVNCALDSCECPDNLVANPGFSIGAMEGNLGGPGASTNWTTATGSPQVTNTVYCCDPFLMQMWGNQDLGESIAQTGFNFQPGKTYRISFKAKFYNQNLPANYVRFGFTAANGIVDPFTCTTCENMGETGNITSQVCDTYTLPDWTVASTTAWNTLLIRAFNNTPDVPTDPNTISWGRIDNICITEVKKDCIDPPPGMVSWWSMDDQDGDPYAVDLLGQNPATPLPSGTIGFGGPFATPGKVGGALSFVSPPGTMHLSAPDNASQNFGAGSFSIDAWVSTNGGTGTEPILDKLGNSSNGYSFSLQTATFGPPFYPTLVLGDGSGVQVLQGPPITLGDWNLVSVSVDAQQNMATFCVGDVSANTFTTSSVPITAYNASSPGRPILIGYNQFNPHWNIVIDELELFNRAVSTAEFQAIFEADTLGKCKPNSDCVCGTFSNLFARPAQGAQSIPLTCGGNYVFACPPAGQSISITGSFECQGTNCPPTSTVSWTLIEPDGTSTSGNIQAGPYFSLPIAPLQYAQTGTYTLILKGNCGGVDCPPCTIKFDIDCSSPCPCTQQDILALQSNVNAGFALASFPLNCKACFSPLALSDCEMVEWHLNTATGPLIGMSTGNQTICYNFSHPGVYTVVMVVSRKKQDGSLCETFVSSKTFTFNCVSLSGCTGTVLPNPDFEINPVSGGLGSGGTGSAPGWKTVWGDPHVDERDGTKWGIKLTGNLDTADVLTTTASRCMAKGTDYVVLRGSINTNRSNLRSCAVFFNRNESYTFNVFNPENCFHVATIDMTPYDSSEFELEIPYNLSTWAALDTCGDAPHGVLIRPIIYATSALGNAQGGEETRSEMFLDAFCLGGTLVSVKDYATLSNLRIFPNPNPGVFSVELPEAAKPDMSFQIIDLTGRPVQTQAIKPGSAQQTVQAGSLPSGLYFLQVLAEGKVLAVEKFVKE